LGALYLETGRLKEAEEQYRLGLQLDGDAWPAVVGLAHVYAAQGKTNEAERLFRRALAKRAAPAYHIALADFLQEQNRLEEARVHYLQALARVPYHAGARTQLGNLYAKQQNWPAAREQYERALKLNPKLAGAWYNLGRLEMLQGNSDAAMKHFARAVELQPGFAPAYNSLGSLLALRGQLDAAIFYYQQALASDPNFVEAHVNLAEALARRGRFDPARTHFEVALKLQTNSARAHLGLAGVYAAQRQTADAIRHLREAIPLDPQNPEPLNNLAWLLATHPDAAVRDGAEAVRLATRAVELSKTNDVDMLDTLAAAQAETGQFAQAAATAQQAIALAQQRGQGEIAGAISNRLERYQQGRGWRQE
jgi:tetratricopeptide (TPR) repeat protein